MKNILTYTLLGSTFLFSALSVAAEARDVYFNPDALSADINWENISWVDVDGNATAAPDEDSNVFLSGQRATNYRHVIVTDGSDITLSTLTIANAGWAGNTWRTLDIIGTSTDRVNFTVTNGIAITQNFNSLYAAYTNFKTSTISLPYYGRLDFTESTFESGAITGGNVTTIEFNATTGTASGINLGNLGYTTLKNNSSLTVTNDFYTTGAHTFNIENSSFAVQKHFILSGTSTLNLTDSKVNINNGMRFTNAGVTLNAKNSELIIQSSTYNGATAQAFAVGDGHISTIVLENSTIKTNTAHSIDIKNAASTINISKMDKNSTVITTGTLNFTGVLTVDFTGMGLTENTYFSLISASNAETLFESLFQNNNLIVKGLEDGESYYWVVTSSNIGIQFNAIPEPATYAAIFGALALAFAAYRRRK